MYELKRTGGRYALVTVGPVGVYEVQRLVDRIG
jgi:hypothetical protein